LLIDGGGVLVRFKFDYLVFLGPSHGIKEIFFSNVLVARALGLCVFIFSLILPVQANGNTIPAGLIRVDKISSDSCFRFTDQYNTTKKNQNRGEPVSPLPPSFFAKVAKEVPCEELHHFQVFSIRTEKAARASSLKPSTFCRSLLSEFQVLDEVSIRSLSRTLTTGRSNRSACMVIGFTSANTVHQGTFYIEELYGDKSKLWNGN